MHYILVYIKLLFIMALQEMDFYNIYILALSYPFIF